MIIARGYLVLETQQPPKARPTQVATRPCSAHGTRPMPPDMTLHPHHQRHIARPGPLTPSTPTRINKATKPFLATHPPDFPMIKRGQARFNIELDRNALLADIHA